MQDLVKLDLHEYLNFKRLLLLLKYELKVNYNPDILIFQWIHNHYLH